MIQVKNLRPVLKSLLPIAAFALFFIQLSSCGAPAEKTEAAAENKPAAVEAPAETAAESTTKAADGAFTVAIINMDTVQEQLQMMLDLDKKLKGIERAAATKLTNTEQAIRSEMEEFQQKIQAGMYTQIEGEAKYRELEARGTQFEQQRIKEDERLYKIQGDLTREIKTTMDEFLRRYNDEHGYDMIMRYGSVSEIFQHDGATDITREVLDGLNSEYEASKNKPEAAK